MTNPAPRESQPMLTIAEIATELSVHQKTVRRLIEAGELPVHRIGRAIRIAAEDLATYRNRQRGYRPLKSRKVQKRPYTSTSS